MIKHHDQGNISKEGYILVYGPRGIKIYYGREAWQHVAGMVVRAGP